MSQAPPRPTHSLSINQFSYYLKGRALAAERIIALVLTLATHQHPFAPQVTEFITGAGTSKLDNENLYSQEELDALYLGIEHAAQSILAQHTRNLELLSGNVTADS